MCASYTPRLRFDPEVEDTPQPIFIVFVDMELGPAEALA
jgi:hypothetical protein